MNGGSYSQLSNEQYESAVALRWFVRLGQSLAIGEFLNILVSIPFIDLGGVLEIVLCMALSNLLTWLYRMGEYFLRVVQYSFPLFITRCLRHYP